MQLCYNVKIGYNKFVLSSNKITHKPEIGFKYVFQGIKIMFSSIYTETSDPPRLCTGAMLIVSLLYACYLPINLPLESLYLLKKTVL
jgi:hypothetical protein